MKNNFWTKIPKNGHCVTKQNNIKTRKNEKISLATVSVLEFVYLIIAFVLMYFFQKLNLPNIKWFLSVLLLNECFKRNLPQSQVNGRFVPRWFNLPFFSDSDLTRRWRLKTVLYCPITLILAFPLFFPPTTDRFFDKFVPARKFTFEVWKWRIHFNRKAQNRLFFLSFKKRVMLLNKADFQFEWIKSFFLQILWIILKSFSFNFLLFSSDLMNWCKALQTNRHLQRLSTSRLIRMFSVMWLNPWILEISSNIWICFDSGLNQNEVNEWPTSSGTS